MACGTAAFIVSVAYFGCDDDSRPSSPLTAKQSLPAAERAELTEEAYVQALAEKHAPLLYFDKTVPGPGLCFPMDAAEYYDKRKSEIHGIIYNQDYEKIENGEVPIYYEYNECHAEFEVEPPVSATASNCVPLIARKNVEIGTVCLNEVQTGDAKFVEVTYNLTAGWELTKVHFWLGNSPLEIPQAQRGNPNVHSFPYKSHDLDGQTSHTFQLPLPPMACGEWNYAAAHAKVRENNAGGGSGSESAWAGGNGMADNGPWATTFAVRRNCTAEIMYWMFYGWQSQCAVLGIFPAGRHHGDWERIVAKIEDGEMTRVMFFQHSGWCTKIVGGQHPILHDGSHGGKPGVHPVVYVGKKSHASYHFAGGGPDIWECHYWRDYRNPGSNPKHMHTELNLVRLRFDGSGPEWMTYNGGWADWEFGTSDKGPFGPISQGNPPRCNMPGCYGWDEHCNNIGDDQQGCFPSDIKDNEIF